MCTLTFAWRWFDDYLTVAANRDELYARPATGPTSQGSDPLVVAPRDEEAGGTWIGYNDEGLFAALTNRWTRTIPPGDRSRGLLVRDTLDRNGTDTALTFVREELDKRRYEPFQLVLADQHSAVVLEYDGDVSVSDLASGVYVVGNTGWCGVRSGPADAAERQRTESFFVPQRDPERGREHAANERRVLNALVAAAENTTAAAWLEAAGEVLGDHEYGVCVHGDGFGTKSASLIRLGTERIWRYADGPPCEAEFELVRP